MNKSFKYSPPEPQTQPEPTPAPQEEVVKKAAPKKSSKTPKE